MSKGRMMRRLVITLWFFSGGLGLHGQTQTAVADLPDDPEVQLLLQGNSDMQQMMETSGMGAPEPCAQKNLPPAPRVKGAAGGKKSQKAKSPCIPLFDPYEPFVNSQMITPMTVRQKGLLAVYDVIRPVNLLTIAFTSAFGVAIDSHSAYGPGMRGWGRDMGYSLLQDAQGEAVGTFAITSLTHEDPRYHRMPNASTMRRFWHAVGHTYVSRHDDGRSMPNYETLVGFPIESELSDLYVPGLQTDSRSTAARVAIALAANPADDLITEFLPDVAEHIHLRVVFVRQVLDKVAAGQMGQ